MSCAPKPDSCKHCLLWGDGTGWVGPEGSASNGVLLVGEAAGEQEARAGRPFVGPAGRKLNYLLRRAGLLRDSFGVANVLSCRPPNNKLLGAPYEFQAIRECTPNLDRAIRQMAPRVLVPLGGIALERLTAGAYGKRITRVNGFVLDSPYGVPVVPTFHPSYLLPRPGQQNTARFTGAVILALKRAVRLAREGFARQPTRYTYGGVTVAQLAAYVREAIAAQPRWLAWDIETSFKTKIGDESSLVATRESEEATKAENEETEDEVIAPRPNRDPITMIGFAYREGEAISVPWLPPYLPLIYELLQGVPRYVTWNGTGFDIPAVEEALGCRLSGINYDMMWAWHLLQSDLPRGLEAVAAWATDLAPWKHFGSAGALIGWYNCIDADAELRIANWLEAQLRTSGQWTLFERHVVQLDPILLQAGARTGVHIDRKAQNALAATLDAELATLDDAVQRAVPDVVRPARIYRRVPAGKTYQEVSLRARVRACDRCGKTGVNKKHPCLRDGAALVDMEQDRVGYRVLGRFNPNSATQLLGYVKYFKHPLAYDRKTQRESLPKKLLERLDRTFGSKGHTIYGLALRTRAVKKTLGTYVRGFVPDATDKVYTTYTHAPSSGRLSSRAVNLQNVSHRGTALFAEEVRRTIVPPPGWVFVEADSSAIEAVMTGYFMGSATYIELAHRGIHDYLTCLAHHLSFPDDIAICKGQFKATRDRKKVIVHGTSYGMTPRLLYYENYGLFKSEHEARKEQQHFLDVCPGLAEWQDAVRRLAHKQTYLQNPWGYRHFFYDVFTRDEPEGPRSLGSDAKRCVSFLPQSSAAAFMKDNATLIAQAVRPEWIPANFLCHDSYCLQVPPTDLDVAVALLETVLTRPIPEMDGLRVGCEIKTGKNWADMETVKTVAVLHDDRAGVRRSELDRSRDNRASASPAAG